MAIYVGLGANLDHPRYGNPRHTLGRALTHFSDHGLDPVRMGGWYRTSPMPPSGQPWYVNTVAEIRTGLGPDATLAALHRIEDAFGRVRGERDGPRWIDLDLLDYDGVIKDSNIIGLSILPHVRIHLRGFVLLPLADLAPEWRHPVSGESIATLVARLPPDQVVMPLDD